MKLSTNITKAAEEALGKRMVSKGGKGNTKPWFTEEVKILAHEKRDAYLQFRSRTITYNDYKVIRNRVNGEIQMIKRHFWERFSMDMEHDLYGGQKKVWNMLRNRKKPVNEYIHTTTITTEEWENYFHTLYNDTKDKQNTNIASLEDNQDVPSGQQHMVLTAERIKSAALQLKNRKAPGLDQINNELIKYGGQILLDQLEVLFNKIYNEKKVPKQWRESITIPVFKKGVKTDPKNYRGISLLSSTSKLLTKIISEEVAQTGISEEQQGFRRNRSTTDAIFILRQIAEKAIEYNKTAFMCFIDLTQAFDRVRLSDVLKLLKERSLDPHILSLIKEMNIDNSTFIRVGNKLSKEIPIMTGIRQGDSLSPMLFNVIMDEIIKEVKPAGRGYRMGRKEVKIVCYADDAVIISEDEDNLQRMLFKFETAAKKFNMIISVQKTQSLTISREPRRCKLAVYNESIEQVMKFKYLGANITSNRNLKEEVQAQTTRAALMSGFLRDIIWKNKYMSVDGKVRIYKTCIRPIMTYGTETRAETATTKQLLRTTEMKTLRAITGHTLRDRVRNEDVRSICDVQDIVRWARTRRRAWRDHVNRMTPDRLARIVKEEKPNTSRPVGRPPKRWHESWTSASQE